MDAVVPTLSHHSLRFPPRPPLLHLRSAGPVCCSSLLSSFPLRRRQRREGSRPPFDCGRGAFFGGGSSFPLPSDSRLCNNVPRRRIPKASAGAFWGRSSSSTRRKRGRKGGGGSGLDRAAVESWASIFLLAASIRKLLVMQPLDILAVLIEHGEGARIDGGGVLGFLKRGLSGGGNARKSKGRTWKAALGLAVKAASAVAAAAAIWLLLFGCRLL